jgi:type VII secretion-associated serine protease mycosin
MISWLAAICSFAVLLPSPAAAADAISEGQWFNAYLNVDSAHSVSVGSGVTVAVVDTGTDSTHPDLKGSILPGKDYLSPSQGNIDTHGHGTAMTGLIVGSGRVGGIAPEAKVVPIRVYENAEGRSSFFAEGIEWAADHGAKVICVAGGGAIDDLLLRQLVEAAIRADVVVVAAVGNRTTDTQVIYPAAIAGVLAVGSVDRDGNLAPNSVTGPAVVLTAPGNGISSTRLNGGYAVTNGTSNATAITAGAVALVRARFPELKAPEVIRRLTATATDKGAPGRDNEYGYGVLNLVGALTADLPTSPTARPAVTATLKAGPAEPGRTGGFQWWWLVALPIAAVAVGLGAVIIRKRQSN